MIILPCRPGDLLRQPGRVLEFLALMDREDIAPERWEARVRVNNLELPRVFAALLERTDEREVVFHHHARALLRCVEWCGRDALDAVVRHHAPTKRLAAHLDSLEDLGKVVVPLKLLHGITGREAFEPDPEVAPAAVDALMAAMARLDAEPVADPDRALQGVAAGCVAQLCFAVSDRPEELDELLRRVSACGAASGLLADRVVAELLRQDAGAAPHRGAMLELIQFVTARERSLGDGGGGLFPPHRTLPLLGGLAAAIGRVLYRDGGDKSIGTLSPEQEAELLSVLLCVQSILVRREVGVAPRSWSFRAPLERWLHRLVAARSPALVAAASGLLDMLARAVAEHEARLVAAGADSAGPAPPGGPATGVVVLQIPGGPAAVAYAEEEEEEEEGGRQGKEDRGGDESKRDEAVEEEDSGEEEADDGDGDDDDEDDDDGDKGSHEEDEEEEEKEEQPHTDLTNDPALGFRAQHDAPAFTRAARSLIAEMSERGSEEVWAARALDGGAALVRVACASLCRACEPGCDQETTGVAVALYYLLACLAPAECASAASRPETPAVQLLAESLERCEGGDAEVLPRTLLLGTLLPECRAQPFRDEEGAHAAAMNLMDLVQSESSAASKQSVRCLVLLSRWKKTRDVVIDHSMVHPCRTELSQAVLALVNRPGADSALEAMALQFVYAVFRRGRWALFYTNDILVLVEVLLRKARDADGPDDASLLYHLRCLGAVLAWPDYGRHRHKAAEIAELLGGLGGGGGGEALREAVRVVREGLGGGGGGGGGGGDGGVGEGV